MEFRDLKKQYQKYKIEIDNMMQKTAESAQFIGGSVVSELEKSLAEYVGVKHCITCANGTDALELVLMAWGIGEGDAVFVPDFTFFSSGEVVSSVGATPIFVDVDERTFNIDPDKLEEMIIRLQKKSDLKPRVIIPVDLFGLPADYDLIKKIAEKYNLLILEDAAQGFGGAIRGQVAGSFGNAATTSFFPAKPLGCYGDGGAIFTNDDELGKILRSLCVHGKGADKYDNVRIGMNSRLDTLQANILKVKLKAFSDHELEDVNYVYKQYSKHLSKSVMVPYIPEGYRSSFAQYTIILPSAQIRDALKQHLADKGIPSMIYYVKPMHKQKAFTMPTFVLEEDYTVTNRLVDCVLSLPMHPYLEQEDIQKVSDAILQFFE